MRDSREIHSGFAALRLGRAAKTNPHRGGADGRGAQIASRNPILLRNPLFALAKKLLKF
jgi:hypothetical protein